MAVNVKFKGVGVYLPKTVWPNKKLTRHIDTTAEWVYDKLGIKERRIAKNNETVVTMGYHAAVDAIKNAGLTKEDIDMIIVATSSPSQISPAIACVIHNRLNIDRDIPAFDINAVCSGFVYATSIAASLIDGKTYKNILIVASEAYSKITDWNNKHCVFFGDGAGAVVLSMAEHGTMTYKLHANGKDTGMTGFKLLSSTGIFEMQGREVWNQAIKVLPDVIMDIMQENNIGPADIDLLIPHQPSIHILETVADKLNLPMTKVKTVMDRYANIAGASIPIALHDALINDEIKNGDTVILAAIGSGWTWGTILINYEK